MAGGGTTPAMGSAPLQVIGAPARVIGAPGGSPLQTAPGAAPARPVGPAPSPNLVSGAGSASCLSRGPKYCVSHTHARDDIMWPKFLISIDLDQAALVS